MLSGRKRRVVILIERQNRNLDAVERPSTPIDPDAADRVRDGGSDVHRDLRAGRRFERKLVRIDEMHEIALEGLVPNELPVAVRR